MPGFLTGLKQSQSRLAGRGGGVGIQQPGHLWHSLSTDKAVTGLGVWLSQQGTGYLGSPQLNPQHLQKPKQEGQCVESKLGETQSVREETPVVTHRGDLS